MLRFVVDCFGCKLRWDLVDLIVRKMMKKLSGWILGVLFAGSAIAEPTQTLTTNINGYVGGEVNVSVEHSAIDASTGMTGIGFRIHYDSAALSNASLKTSLKMDSYRKETWRTIRI